MNNEDPSWKNALKTLPVHTGVEVGQASVGEIRRGMVSSSFVADSFHVTIRRAVGNRTFNQEDLRDDAMIVFQ